MLYKSVPFLHLDKYEVKSMSNAGSLHEDDLEKELLGAQRSCESLQHAVATLCEQACGFIVLPGHLTDPRTGVAVGDRSGHLSLFLDKSVCSQAPSLTKTGSRQNCQCRGVEQEAANHASSITCLSERLFACEKLIHRICDSLSTSRKMSHLPLHS